MQVNVSEKKCYFYVLRNFFSCGLKFWAWQEKIFWFSNWYNFVFLEFLLSTVEKIEKKVTKVKLLITKWEQQMVFGICTSKIKIFCKHTFDLRGTLLPIMWVPERNNSENCFSLLKSMLKSSKMCYWSQWCLLWNKYSQLIWWEAVKGVEILFLPFCVSVVQSKILPAGNPVQ